MAFDPASYASKTTPEFSFKQSQQKASSCRGKFKFVAKKNLKNALDSLRSHDRTTHQIWIRIVHCVTAWDASSSASSACTACIGDGRIFKCYAIPSFCMKKSVHENICSTSNNGLISPSASGLLNLQVPVDELIRRSAEQPPVTGAKCAGRT